MDPLRGQRQTDGSTDTAPPAGDYRGLTTERLS